MGEVVATSFAPDESDDSERADESKRIDRCVEKGGAESIAAAGHQTEQRITGVGDGGISEEPAHIRLGERYEVADQNGERGENRDDQPPTGDHCMPGRGSLDRPKTEQQTLSQDEKGSDLRG